MVAAKALENERVRVRLARFAIPAVKPMDPEQAKQWQTLKDDREFPWNRGFKAIEGAATKDIELLEFVPDKVHRHLMLRGEAKDNAALIEYLDALTMQPHLRAVHLVRRQPAKREGLVFVEFEIRGKF
ncbi:hypothetical protein C7C56_013345 [Massilia glaciei]|uniref:Uncharacterized protein n=1 Tax=Massilia glaciei TaxID=1524097 RepID=A0A2U2HK54_9BURK|nr:hypothetical protein C7C56_013345 [Massilia glaciei]